MELHLVSVRIASVRGFIAALVKKLGGEEPRVAKAVSPRMCPFCGLMTPRSRPNCLECGKSLKPT